MKVLMIGWELPPFNSGGLGVACFYLAKELNKKIDLTFTLPIKLPIKQTPFKVLFTETEYQKLEGYFSRYYPISNDILDLIFTYAERILKSYKEKPDIIHGHDWFSAPAVYLLQEFYKVNGFIHVHSTEVERTSNNPHPVIYQIEKEYFQKINYLLPVSDLTKEILIKAYQINEKKIFTLPNGFEWIRNNYQIADYLENLKKDGWQIVLFVGRLTLQKGPDYLIKAIPLIKTKLPKTKFVFVGSGDMFPQLVSLAYDLKVSQDIIFTSFLREEKLFGIYKSADVLVVPSVADPFGLVPLEGLNNDLPILISKTTGVGYYLNHILKFDFWDIKEMANKIIGLLKYEKMKNEYLSNSQKEAKEKFCWSKTANQLISIYNKCLQ